MKLKLSPPPGTGAYFTDRDKSVLFGELRVKVVVKRQGSTSPSGNLPLRVRVLAIPTQRGETEYELESETDASPSPARLQGTTPFFFRDMPVGDMTVEVRYGDGSGAQEVKQLVALKEQMQEVVITVKPAAVSIPGTPAGAVWVRKTFGSRVQCGARWARVSSQRRSHPAKQASPTTSRRKAKATRTP